jgi:hypothetical protein
MSIELSRTKKRIIIYIYDVDRFGNSFFTYKILRESGIFRGRKCPRVIKEIKELEDLGLVEIVPHRGSMRITKTEERDFERIWSCKTKKEKKERERLYEIYGFRPGQRKYGKLCENERKYLYWRDKKRNKESDRIYLGISKNSVLIKLTKNGIIDAKKLKLLELF